MWMAVDEDKRVILTTLIVALRVEAPGLKVKIYLIFIPLIKVNIVICSICSNGFSKICLI